MGRRALASSRTPTRDGVLEKLSSRPRAWTGPAMAIATPTCNPRAAARDLNILRVGHLVRLLDVRGQAGGEEVTSQFSGQTHRVQQAGTIEGDLLRIRWGC